MIPITTITLPVARVNKCGSQFVLAREGRPTVASPAGKKRTCPIPLRSGDLNALSVNDDITPRNVQRALLLVAWIYEPRRRQERKAKSLVPFCSIFAVFARFAVQFFLPSFKSPGCRRTLESTAVETTLPKGDTQEREIVTCSLHSTAYPPLDRSPAQVEYE